MKWKLLVCFESQLGQMMFSGAHSWCLAKADTWKNIPEADTGDKMLWCSKHVKGPVMEEYTYDSTDSGDEHWALVWLAPLHYSALTTCMISSPCIELLSSICSNAAIERNRLRTAPEVPVAACHFSGLRLVGKSWGYGTHWEQELEIINPVLELTL